MTTPVAAPRIGVIGLSLELYDQRFPGYRELLREQLDRFVKPLTAYGAVAHVALCFTREQAEEAVRQSEAHPVDALVLIPLSYTASGIIAPAAKATRLPIVIWNTQEAETIREDYDFDALRMNHVTQGTQDVTSVLTREQVRFGLESGHYQDAEAHRRLGEWLDAARAYGATRVFRVGCLGQPFPGMDDFQFDADEARRRLHVEPVDLALNDYGKRLREVDDDKVARVVAQDASRYEIGPDLDSATHRRSVRHELAMRALIADHRLDAFTMNFIDLTGQPDIDTLPFLGINKLMGEGLGYAGEGDVLRAAQMAQARLLCGLATFSEIFTIDYRNRRMLMTHMQECNPAWARRDTPIRLLKKTFWAPGMEPYAGMWFTLEPGPVTFAALTALPGNSLGYIAYETRIQDRPPLARLDIPHWVVELDEPPGDFLTRYGRAGGPHHLVALQGHQLGRLEKLAHFQGLRMEAV